MSLSPADLPKEGGRFDLPIALGILIASRQVRPPARTAHAGPTVREFYGELGLAGELKAVPGLLPAAAQSQRAGHELIVPRANAVEAAAVAPLLVRAADHLLEVCAHVAGSAPLDTAPALQLPPAARARGRAALDLADVRGQLHAKRALLIAAAGGHSLLMIGPPGCGKSMLAQRLPGLLPPLTHEEALEVAAVASLSAAGFRPEALGERPFRAPHHSASGPALVGGGARARPGEISLAHHGVLFLDELPEFDRHVLESLREPLESGAVAVARAAAQVRYPAAFQLIAAMNPCPCGRQGDPSADCRCTPAQVRGYRARISAPLLDRIDLRVEVPRLAATEFDAPDVEDAGSGPASAQVRRARDRQLARQGVCNARLADPDVERWCLPDERGRGVLEAAMRRVGFSGRARQRLLRVARTIADLEESHPVGAAHVAEAVMLRRLERTAEEPNRG